MYGISTSVYIEALGLSQQLELDEKGTTAQQRIHNRVRILEMAATAAHVFATVQSVKVCMCQYHWIGKHKLVLGRYLCFA